MFNITFLIYKVILNDDMCMKICSDNIHIALFAKLITFNIYCLWNCIR